MESMCLITRGAHPCLVCCPHTAHYQPVPTFSTHSLLFWGSRGAHLAESGQVACDPSLSLYHFLSLLSLAVPHLSQNIRTRKPRKMCCPVREIRNSKKKAKEQKSQRKHEKNGECNKHTRKLSPILHSLVHHIDFAANHCIPEDLSDSDL